jgi:hypothetical protein
VLIVDNVNLPALLEDSTLPKNSFKIFEEFGY